MFAAAHFQKGRLVSIALVKPVFNINLEAAVFSIMWVGEVNI